MNSPRTTAFCLAAALAWGALAAQDARQEEAEDYFRDWLENDVVYIITPEERAVFGQLKTEDEKTQFIEAFWRRRDPNPQTPENSFKEEHYRRIAYANEHFSAGIPGWKTDRGRFYIKYGPPAQRDVYPTGTVHQDNRGGVARALEGRSGFTGPRRAITFPFEVWRYRYIEGVGSDVEIEFVDKSGSGLYKLAYDEDEKDVYAYRDMMTDPTSIRKSDFFKHRKDRDFYKTEMFASLADAPEIQFKDLQEVVSSQVSYDDLPFQLDTSQLRVTGNSYYVPVTVALPTSNLDFELTESGGYKASVNIFIQARDVSKRIQALVEDELVLTGTEQQLKRMRRGSAMYSKKILLSPGRSVVDVVLKDANSGKVGNRRELVVIESGEGLSLSSLIMADVMRPLAEEESLADPFSLGQHKVVPNVGGRFRGSQKAGLYFQIYGLLVDQSTLEPDVRLTTRFKKGDKALVTIEDDLSTFGQVNGKQASVTISVPLAEFPSGRIDVEVEVEDKLSGEKTSSATHFIVEAE